MKKKLIKYGILNMMEYHMTVSVGKSKVNVIFTGGSSNAASVVPASFTTDNLMLQIAIQNCRDFKRGLIKIIKTTELDEEVPILRNSREKGDELSGKGDEEPTATDFLKTQPSQSDVPTATDNEPPATGNELKEVKVNVNDDAKEYLETNFGVNRSKLLNRETIQKIAAEHGIVFIFAK